MCGEDREGGSTMGLKGTFVSGVNILFVVMLHRYIHVLKTYQIICFKCVQLILCQLYLSKAVNKLIITKEKKVHSYHEIKKFKVDQM